MKSIVKLSVDFEVVIPSNDDIEPMDEFILKNCFNNYFRRILKFDVKDIELVDRSVEHEVLLNQRKECVNQSSPSPRNINLDTIDVDNIDITIL